MVVKITDAEAKKEILNTQFHQVFHISLTNPFISEDINNDWYNNWYKKQDDETSVSQYLHSITIENDYLEDRKPSNIEGECVRVISGDTLVLETGEYISIAGVKAPNINTDVGIAVKEAVEGACLNQYIRLRFDPDCKYDNNNKLLCMVAFDTTKSLNKLLLKYKLCKYVAPASQILAQELESESTLYANTLSNTSEYLDHQFVNVTIPLEKICNIEASYGIGAIYNSFNNDFTNILITNINDYSVIHQCEIYQDVLFIRLQPYVDTIALHILPKTYNTSDDLLLVRDITEGWQKDFSQDYYNMHNDERKNLYFQMQKSDGEIVDRSGREEDGYPEFSNLKKSPYMYYRLDNTNCWLEDPYTKTFGEISYPISDYALTNVQINVGYKYNESSPCNAVHYTGTKDMTNTDCQDRLTLIDCNLDNITDNTNVISQLQCVDNQLIFPTDADILVNNGFTNSTGLHSINDNIGRLYHKTIKYYNDNMYSEEFDGQNTNYMFSEYDSPIIKVSYLQSHGGQVINTGYILKANDTVEVVYSSQATDIYESVFGARSHTYQHNAYGLFIRFSSDNTIKDQNVYFRTGQEQQGADISQNLIYKVITNQNECKVYHNENLIDTINITNGVIEDCINPCGLFTLNTALGEDKFTKDYTQSHMKIYEFKIISDDGKIQRHMIPVRKNNVGYMYDLVTKQLYGNVGNGKFLYGSDV